MASSVCRKRLQKELIALKKNPVEHVVATPHEKNILEWHYVIEGPKGSVYEGGFYHGVLRFPKEYPYKPPSILMFTTNGRFKTNTRLCLSMSDFHPETWNPMWSVSSILSGLLSFMLDSTPTLGAIEMSDSKRRAFATKSLEENCRSKDFCLLFPQYVELYNKRRKAKMLENKEKALLMSLKEKEKKTDNEQSNKTENEQEEEHEDEDEDESGGLLQSLGFDDIFIKLSIVSVVVVLVAMIVSYQ